MNRDAVYVCVHVSQDASSNHSIKCPLCKADLYKTQGWGPTSVILEEEIGASFYVVGGETGKGAFGMEVLKY